MTSNSNGNKATNLPQKQFSLTPKITIHGKEVCFNNKKQTVLECLETSEIDMHYHCRDGFCGACRVTLLTGEIHYPQGEPLAFVGESEILPCCCVPVTDISLKVDD